MQSTLLLDNGYQPVDVICWKDAIRLMVLDKAEIVEEYERSIRSMYLVMKMPAVIRLIHSFKRKKNKVKFSRVNIYARDKHKCQYCRKNGNMSDFTFDHVVPKCRGGKTSWTNIVTCCKKCNSKKADKTPSEVGMRLLKNPVQPVWLPAVTISLSQRPVPEAWRDYLFWHSSLTEED